jgi:hypothetical protein
MMRHLAALATERGLATIRIMWKPSERNDAACHFFSRIPGARFVEVESYGAGVSAHGADGEGDALDAHADNDDDDEEERTHSDADADADADTDADADAGVDGGSLSGRNHDIRASANHVNGDRAPGDSGAKGDVEDTLMRDGARASEVADTDSRVNERATAPQQDTLMMFWTPELEPLSKRDRKRELRRRAREAEKQDQQAQEARRRARAEKRAAERQKQPRVELVSQHRPFGNKPSAGYIIVPTASAKSLTIAMTARRRINTSGHAGAPTASSVDSRESGVGAKPGWFPHCTSHLFSLTHFHTIALAQHGTARTHERTQ